MARPRWSTEPGHGATLQSACANQHLTVPGRSDGRARHRCAAAVATDYVLPSAVIAPVLPLARIRAELARAPLPPHLRRWLEGRR
jgi:hypothetical protein